MWRRIRAHLRFLAAILFFNAVATVAPHGGLFDTGVEALQQVIGRESCTSRDPSNSTEPFTIRQRKAAMNRLGSLAARGVRSADNREFDAAYGSTIFVGSTIEAGGESEDQDQAHGFFGGHRLEPTLAATLSELFGRALRSTPG
jgi:hypothetical protein